MSNGTCKPVSDKQISAGHGSFCLNLTSQNIGGMTGMSTNTLKNHLTYSREKTTFGCIEVDGSCGVFCQGFLG